MIKVAVIDDYQDAARTYGDWSAVQRDAEVTVFHDHLSQPDDIVARLRDFSVICVTRERTPMTRAIVARLPKLKLIVTTGHWNASIDMQATADHGVTVCGSRPDEESCSEFTFALILGLLRRINVESQSLRDGAWQTTVGSGLRGRILGILGLGKIGARVARIARAFDMDVIAWSQNLTEERAAAAQARLVDRDGLFRESDVLSIHVVLGERTHHLLGAREFGLMKRTAYLINTARGPIVDEAAMVDALAHGRIAGAALDVFDVEPLPAVHPLRELSNVLLTPHIAGVTEERYRGRYQDMADDVRAWLDGKPIRLFGPDGRLLKTGQ